MGHVCNLDQVPASTGAAWVDETPINRAFTASVHGFRTSPWTLEGDVVGSSSSTRGALGSHSNWEGYQMFAEGR